LLKIKLKKGLEASFISETTELPLEEIEQLKKDI